MFLLNFSTSSALGSLRFIFILLLGIGVISCAEPPPKRVKLSGATMGTTYSVVFLPDSQVSVSDQALQLQIDNRLVQINQVASTYIDDSELSLLNQHTESSAFPLSEDLRYLLQESVAINRVTLGALDVTVGPLVNLWGFGPDKKPSKIPTEQQVEQARVISGIDKLQLTPQGATKAHPELYVDLSTIAKGYAVDELANILESHHIHNYIVEIGGELRVKGLKEVGNAWRIAIEKPVSEEKSVQRILEPGTNGVATSGDYRNFYEQDGIRYSHIINPQTGLPISHRLVSVTVFHPSCAQADGLATGFMVLGQDKGLQVANERGIAALFIEKNQDGEFVETYSSAMAAYILRD